MNYSEAIQFLHGLQVFGANFGLETPRRLAALAGNPHGRLRFIHVAGTNGKGSTCAMLESIYRAAGLRVGLFTSPHLVSFRERIQVNRQIISQSDVARFVAEIQESLKTFPADQHPTLFEVVTVAALKYFAEQKCDLVIWETGLGGRLDATNIVTPLASVITNIALDHQQWLGDTLEKITAEKAGIIKPGVPVVTAADQPEVLRVIEQTAKPINAPLTRVPSSTLHSLSSLPLLGEHQRLNAALAVATVNTLQNRIPVSAEQIRAGLASVNWPGRLQFVERGDQKFLLDGAHNVAGAEALRTALLEWEGRRAAVPNQTETFGSPAWRPSQTTLILGVLGDKDWKPMCEILAPLAVRILPAPVNSERTAAAEQLAAVCRQINPAANVTACASLPDALERAAQDGFVVIAGSLYLVGEALELLDPAFAQSAGERGLNEWRAPAVPGR